MSSAPHGDHARVALPPVDEGSRLVVMADVHGNLPALQAVLASLADDTPRYYVVAGDLTACPHNNETIRLLHSLGSHMILGNTDLALLDLARGRAPEAWSAAEQYALLRWNLNHLQPDVMTLLEGLPTQLSLTFANAPSIRVVHGSPTSPTEGLDPHIESSPLATVLGELEEAVLICGHTHVPWTWKSSGKLALNPGSVAGPLDGTIGAQFALLTWNGIAWQPELRTASYDTDAIRAAFVDSGLLAVGGALARAFLLTIETGRNVPLHLLRHAYRLAAEHGEGTPEVVTDSIWKLASATFDWQAWEREDTPSRSPYSAQLDKRREYHGIHQL